MPNYIPNKRAKGFAKDLLGILLEREPTPQQMSIEGAPYRRGLSAGLHGSFSIRISLRGKTFILAIVSDDQQRKQRGLVWACILADLATLHFMPWRMRKPSNESMFNTSEEDTSAILHENDDENDVMLHLQLIEDSLVNAGDIPSREAMEEEAERIQLGGKTSPTRSTVSAQVASIEAKRALDLKELIGRHIAHDQLANRLLAEMAESKARDGEAAKERAELRQVVCEIRGLCRARGTVAALSVPVAASETVNPPLPPEPAAEGVAGLVDVPLATLDPLTGWRAEE
jgi:hypothetical protein